MAIRFGDGTGGWDGLPDLPFPRRPGGGLPFLPPGPGLPGLPGLPGTPYTPPSPYNPTLGGGDPVGTFGSAGCMLIADARLRAACLALVTGLAGKPPAGAGGTGSPCPPGSFKVRGICVAPGDASPGGDPFTFPAGGGTKMGAFGMPAIIPSRKQVNTLNCPRRYVLGLDSLCYPKGMVPRNMRKWVPESRPLLSAMDNKILTRAKSVQKKLRRVAGKHVPKARTCKPRGKK